MLKTGITFKPPLKPEDIEYRFFEEVIDSKRYFQEKMRILEEQLQESGRLFEDVVKTRKWKEVVIQEIGSFYDGQHIDQTLAPMTSYEVQARRKLLTSKRPVYGVCMLVSSDDEVILGIRSGADEITPYPAYCTKYEMKRELNPLTDSLYAELDEEGGLHKADIEDAKLIGCFYDDRFSKGQVYVWRLLSNNTTKEIIEKQKTATDAWENKLVFPVKNNPDSILEVERSSSYPLFPFASGALPIYCEHLTD